jgi:hypothetical protein
MAYATLNPATGELSQEFPQISDASLFEALHVADTCLRSGGSDPFIILEDAPPDVALVAVQRSWKALPREWAAFRRVTRGIPKHFWARSPSVA